MREFAAPDPQLYASPPRHYRQRAEFRIWHCGDDLFYAMFERGEPRTPLRIDDFAPASWRINELMRALRSFDCDQMQGSFICSRIGAGSRPSPCPA